MENLRLILIMSAEILIGRGRTVQHRLCAVCTLHFDTPIGVAFDNRIYILLVVCGATTKSIVGYFSVKLKFGSWTLRNVRRAQVSPAVLTVKIGLEVGAFSLICQMFAAFRGNWWCDFYPCFCHDKCINLGLGLFPYILMFSCNLIL